MDNLDALDAVEGVVVEGGFDPETAAEQKGRYVRYG
nr:MAG TPA: hypothetical protein [Caudoviricetes sp.]